MDFCAGNRFLIPKSKKIEISKSPPHRRHQDLIFNIFFDCLFSVLSIMVTSQEVLQEVLHGAVVPPRGWPLMSYNGIFFLKKVEKVKKIFFIDVKLDFMRLAHHFDTFFFRFSDRLFLIFQFQHYCSQPAQSGNGLTVPDRFFGQKSILTKNRKKIDFFCAGNPFLKKSQKKLFYFF